MRPPSAMPWPSSAVNSGPRRLSPPPRITETYRNSQPTCSTAFWPSPADRPDLQSQAEGRPRKPRSPNLDAGPSPHLDYGVSSIEPDECGGKVNAGQEASCGLVVAGGDGPELLELGEEVLDEVARLVEILVKGARHLAGFPRRDDDRLAGLGQRLEPPLIRIERLVGNECLGLKLREQGIGASQIVLLTAGQMKADRIAECIHQRVDLGAQPALAAPDRLVGPGFLGAPAAC